MIDEIAGMCYQEAVFDTVMRGLRLGDRPRVLIATTSRMTPFMKRRVAMDNIPITSGSIYDNADHLSAAFLNKVRELYERTRLRLQGRRPAECADQGRLVYRRRMSRT